MKQSTRILPTFYLLILTFFSFIPSRAQQVVSAAGANADNSMAQISWTIGETVIVTFNNENNILTQGIHQSKLTITTIKEFSGASCIISAFPNPVNEYIRLKVVLISPCEEGTIWKDFSCQIYDLSGKMLATKQLEDSETVIWMNGYTPSTYFLKIRNKNMDIKIFKIVKQ